MKKLFLSTFILVGSLSGIAAEEDIRLGLGNLNVTGAAFSFNKEPMGSGGSYITKKPALYVPVDFKNLYEIKYDPEPSAFGYDYFNADDSTSSLYGHQANGPLASYDLGISDMFSSIERVADRFLSNEKRLECNRDQAILNENIPMSKQIGGMFELKVSIMEPQPARIPTYRCYDPVYNNYDYCSATCVDERSGGTALIDKYLSDFKEDQEGVLPSSPANEGCCLNGICTLTEKNLNCNALENTPVADSLPGEFSKFFSAVGLAGLSQTGDGKIPLAMVSFCENCLSPDKEQLKESQKLLKDKLNREAISKNIENMVNAASWLQARFKKSKSLIAEFIKESNEEELKGALKEDYDKFVGEDGKFNAEKMISQYQCLNIDQIRESIKERGDTDCSKGEGAFQAGYASAIDIDHVSNPNSFLTNKNLEHRAYLNHESLGKQEEVFDNADTEKNISGAISGIQFAIIKKYKDFSQLCEKFNIGPLSVAERVRQNEEYAKLIVNDVIKFVPKMNNEEDELTKKLFYMQRSHRAYAILDPIFAPIALTPNFICNKLENFTAGLKDQGVSASDIKAEVEKGFSLREALGESGEERGRTALINLKYMANRLCGQDSITRLTSHICGEVPLNEMTIPKAIYDKLSPEEKPAAVVLRCVRQSRYHKDEGKLTPESRPEIESRGNFEPSSFIMGQVTSTPDGSQVISSENLNENLERSTRSNENAPVRGSRGVLSANDIISKNKSQNTNSSNTISPGPSTSKFTPTTETQSSTVNAESNTGNESIKALDNLAAMKSGAQFNNQPNNLFPGPNSRSLKSEDVESLLKEDSREASEIRDDFINTSQNVNEFINDNETDGMSGKDRIDNVLSGKQDKLFPESELLGNEKAIALQAEIDALKAKMSAAIEEPEDEKLDRALDEISELKRTIASFNNRKNSESEFSGDRSPANFGKPTKSLSGGDYNTGQVGLSNKQRVDTLINGQRNKFGLSASDLKEIYGSDPNRLLTIDQKTNSIDGFAYNNDELIIQSGERKVPVSLDNVDIINGEVKNIILNGKTISFERLSDNSQEAIRLFVNVHHFKPKADQFKALVAGKPQIQAKLKSDGVSYEDLLAAMTLE
jgi:hypothetical protein